MTLRDTAVKAGLRLAVRTGIPAWIGRRRNEAVILSYHNVVSSEPHWGERALHVPVARLDEQLRWLVERYRVVPLAELIERQRNGQAIGGLAAVTFDDGYYGVVRHAAPLLSELACPATIFLVSGAVGKRDPFWWDRLAALSGGEIPERQRWLTEYGGEAERILAAQPPARSERAEPDYLPASTGEIAALDRSLIALGVHTVTHPNLTRQPEARCQAELQHCWQSLRDQFTNAVPIVAYPYGAVDPGVARTVAESGFGGVTLGNTGVTDRDSVVAVPRIFVGPAMSPDALEVRASGLRFSW